LSPAFDINPVSNGDGLKLNISETDNSQDLDLVRDIANYFRIKPDKAEKIIHEVTAAVKNWRKEANSLGISLSEQKQMERAFRIAYTNS
jgi:serine/threonine-protein kinase HipA